MNPTDYAVLWLGCGEWNNTDAGLLCDGAWNHVAITIDGGPKIISFVINGEFNDGGRDRQFGFGRFHPSLHSINTDEPITFTDSLLDHLRDFRVYTRALLTCESMALYQSGTGKTDKPSIKTAATELT